MSHPRRAIAAPGQGANPARLRAGGNPCNGGAAVGAQAEKKPREADTYVPSVARATQERAPRRAGRSRRRSPTRATGPGARKRAHDRTTKALHRIRGANATRQQAEHMKAGAPATDGTDGARIEERQRRPDQSGSGAHTADGAKQVPERGAGRGLRDVGAGPTGAPRPHHRGSIAGASGSRAGGPGISGPPALKIE